MDTTAQLGSWYIVSQMRNVGMGEEPFAKSERYEAFDDSIRAG
jgi:hypothetical protein